MATTAQTIKECMHAYGIHSTTLQPELYVPIPDIPAMAVLNGEEEGEGEDNGATATCSSSAATTETKVTVAAPPPACQIVCGKGMCHRLLCCKPVVV